MTFEETEAMEKRRLRDVYEEKAETFAGSRGGAWSYVDGFCRGRTGADAVDLGCGAGRHLPLLDGFDRVVGADFSPEMLEKARETVRDSAADLSTEFVEADAEHLPFSSRSFDLALYVAGLHHLPSSDSRLRSLRELHRVLSDDGVALLSVWSIEHPRFEGEREEVRGTDGDVYVPIGGRSRFYHVYERRELRRELDRSPLEVASLEMVDGNYYAVVSPG